MENRSENMRQKVAVQHQHAVSYYALPTLASLTVPEEV